MLCENRCGTLCFAGKRACGTIKGVRDFFHADSKRSTGETDAPWLIDVITASRPSRLICSHFQRNEVKDARTTLSAPPLQIGIRPRWTKSNGQMRGPVFVGILWTVLMGREGFEEHGDWARQIDDAGQILDTV